MLTRWKLSNFKAVRRETELEMAPLTIFAGANSSGKSTWIHSILLIAQTLSSRMRCRSIILNGEIIELGQFDDIRSFENESEQFSIGWEYQSLESYDPTFKSKVMRKNYFVDPDSINSVFCDISFDVKGFNESSAELLQLYPSVLSCVLKVDYRDTVDETKGISTMTVTRLNSQAWREKVQLYHLEEPSNPRIQKALNYDVEIDPVSVRDLYYTSLDEDDPANDIERHLIGCIFVTTQTP